MVPCAAGQLAKLGALIVGEYLEVSRMQSICVSFDLSALRLERGSTELNYL